MNIKDYSIACDVLLEQRNETQRVLEERYELFKEGKIPATTFQKETFHLQHMLKYLDQNYDLLTNVLQYKKDSQES